MGVVEPVRWGILSTADINRLVIPGAQASDKVDLLGVASRSRSRAEEYAQRWQIRRAYGSYEELLADPEVEAVYISLPNALHTEWSIRALEAGKHVLCEKPLARSAADAEASFDAADRGARLLSEAFMYRHNPQTSRLTALIADGAIGELRLVRAAFSYSLYDTGNVRLRADLDGGSLMDIGCYCVNACRLLAGEPESVFGRAWIGPTDTDWVFTGSLSFPGNVLALFDSGTALVDRDELEVVGSEGSIFLDDPWHCRRPVIELRGEAAVERIELEPVDSYRLELENLSEAIRNSAELLLGRRDAVAQARTMEALFASEGTGAPVSPRPIGAPESDRAESA